MGFKVFHRGVDARRNGVGVLLKEGYIKSVLEVRRVSDKVITVELEIEGTLLNVVSECICPATGL